MSGSLSQIRLYAVSFGMREDGRSQRFFGGRRANFYSSPHGSPIWGFTATSAGALRSMAFLRE